MEQKEKTAREMQAEEQVRQAKARLNQIRRVERTKTRKEQDHQKFILGGIVVKYFPESYDFSEQEMCRILACAFKNRDIQNMIATVIKDRKAEGPETAHNGEDGVGWGDNDLHLVCTFWKSRMLNYESRPM